VKLEEGVACDEGRVASRSTPAASRLAFASEKKGSGQREREEKEKRTKAKGPPLEQEAARGEVREQEEEAWEQERREMGRCENRGGVETGGGSCGNRGQRRKGKTIFRAGFCSGLHAPLYCTTQLRKKRG
jgi:hypothetical protein